VVLVDVQSVLAIISTCYYFFLGTISWIREIFAGTPTGGQMPHGLCTPSTVPDTHKSKKICERSCNRYVGSWERAEGICHCSLPLGMGRM